MKKSHFKRTIALLLSVSFMLAETTGVFAANTIQPQQPIGTPFTDVTEEEALAFERGLEKELSGVTGADTELSKNAKKKAAALVSLYDTLHLHAQQKPECNTPARHAGNKTREHTTIIPHRP